MIRSGFILMIKDLAEKARALMRLDKKWNLPKYDPQIYGAGGSAAWAKGRFQLLEPWMQE